MMEVRFHDEADDSLLKFAVLIARHGGRWILCRHRDRTTLEVPGGHREPGEDIWETARRELREETGAVEFTIRPVCVYSVRQTGEDGTSGDGGSGERASEPGRSQMETFGMLFFAEVESFEAQLHSEIEEIFLLDSLPENWTYPQIQPKLLEETRRRGFM